MPISGARAASIAWTLAWRDLTTEMSSRITVSLTAPSVRAACASASANALDRENVCGRPRDLSAIFWSHLEKICLTHASRAMTQGQARWWGHKGSGGGRCSTQFFHTAAIMDSATFLQLVDGDREYGLSTLVDVVTTGFHAGVVPRDEHLIPTFNDCPAVLARLLALAYKKGLAPTDRHFQITGRSAPVALILQATSQKFADAHGRTRYRMDWSTHVAGRTARDRAVLLPAAYAAGDIVPSVRLHVRPLGCHFMGWRALQAAYAAGTPVRMRDVFRLPGDVSGVKHLLRPRERAAVPHVIKAWVDAGVVDSLSALPVEWVQTANKRARILTKMYASGCVPVRRHLDRFGPGCAEAVKAARRRYAYADCMQRKCLDLRLHSDLSEIVMKLIRSEDRL